MWYHTLPWTSAAGTGGSSGTVLASPWVWKNVPSAVVSTSITRWVTRGAEADSATSVWAGAAWVNVMMSPTSTSSGATGPAITTEPTGRVGSMLPLSTIRAWAPVTRGSTDTEKTIASATSTRIVTVIRNSAERTRRITERFLGPGSGGSFPWSSSESPPG